MSYLIWVNGRIVLHLGFTPQWCKYMCIEKLITYMLPTPFPCWFWLGCSPCVIPWLGIFWHPTLLPPATTVRNLKDFCRTVTYEALFLLELDPMIVTGSVLMGVATPPNVAPSAFLSLGQIYGLAPNQYPRDHELWLRRLYSIICACSIFSCGCTVLGATT